MHWTGEYPPREKLQLLGAASLSLTELLAIVIGSGDRRHNAVDLSRMILADQSQGLSSLARMNLQELSRYPGIGEVKAIRILASMELARRRMSWQGVLPKQARSSKDLYALIRDVLEDAIQEEFWILFFNRANAFLGRSCLSKGGISGTMVDLKLLFKSSLDRRASGIALAHNHPSGNLKPSQADIQLTRRIMRASKLLDIKVLDHIIVSDLGYYSFIDHDLMGEVNL